MTALYRRGGKRLLDVALALPALALSAPLVLLLALLVRVTMGPPVLFRQRRPGQDGRDFTILKLRTMRGSDTDESGGSDSQRMTRLGAWLRRTSLDELPSLWNVVKGDMSLVGPRPLLPEYLPLYTPAQARRHEVRPGVTGWAQVNGRNSLSWPEKFSLDVWYVDNLSLATDLRILWLTLLKVARREGISAEGHATMPRLRGDR